MTDSSASVPSDSGAADNGAAENGAAALTAGLERRLRSIDATTRRRIEEWAKKLVDLSGRNRLLNYKATKRTTLTFIDPSPDAILARVLDGGAYAFYRPPDLPPFVPGQPREVTPLDDELRRRRPRDRELVTSQRDPVELARSLDAIDRKARAEFEDRGTHVLHLAWGLLVRSDRKSGDEQRAPIVLVPMELSRSSIREPHQLKPAPDGDAILNPALRVKLEVDHGISLPDVDLEELSPDQILARVRSVIPAEWRIEPHASIGIFSFAKEAMYRDLVENASTVAKHLVVRSLVKGQPVPELARQLDIDVPGEDELDAIDDPGYSVIDADSSQRRAIEAANRGLSFVLYGPPGTGKSQTITNIIAEFIARGKSVLFVSEKMAALEVVANRLEEVDLRDLVLELHSAKASRGEVAGALARALDSHLKPNDRGDGAVRAALRESRAALNAYVDALHERRMPLGQSAFEVLGDLARLAGAPALEGPPVDATAATTDDRGRVLSGAERLADAWLPVEEGDAYPWWDLTAPCATAAERERVREVLLHAREMVARVEGIDRHFARAWEWPMPLDVEARRGRIEVGSALATRAHGPIEWLTTDDLAPYGALLDRWAARSNEHHEAVAILVAAFGEQWREFPVALEADLATAIGALTTLLGRSADWDALLRDADELILEMERLRLELDDAADRIRALGEALGVRGRVAESDARRLIEIARLSQERNRPPAEWLSRARLREAEEFVAAHGAEYTATQASATALFSRYEDGLLALGLDPLAERMHRWHGRWWNRLRPQHRADRRVIQGVSRSRTVPTSVLEDLEAARMLRDARSALMALDSRAGRVLGVYARGLDTDIEAVGEALTAADRLLDLPPGETDWTRLGAIATAGSPYDPELERRADGLAAVLDGLAGSIRQVTAAADPERAGAVADWTDASLRGWTDRLESELRNLVTAWSRSTDLGAPGSIAELQHLASARVRADALETELAREERALIAALRSHYRGWDTDWTGLGFAASWAADIRSRYGAALPEAVARRLVAGELEELPWIDYAAVVGELETVATAVAALFADGAPGRPWDRVSGGGVEARAWLDTRLSRVDDLGTWHAFATARHALDALGWGTFTARAVETRVTRADLLSAVRRAWSEAWLLSLEDSVPVLKEFYRAEHERRVGKFRVADTRQIALGRERVLREYVQRKPHPTTVQGGEQAIVRKEALKKRRHLPVRALLAELPTLLPKIKPCLMMSPLSVSHFLSPEATFDLVVFDEASQVPPEDAVNCIYRGRQLIVAGDPKQLPPTAFFQLAAVAEGDGEFEEDIDDFESVLDLCRGIGLPGHSLEWHYRSRHDALIAFSNHYIYDGNLVTFPAPYQHADDLGLQMVHVPDAVFDRGGSATNPVEAKRVVDVVVDHWRRHPSLSLGVVAFSVAQQDVVLNELERRLRAEPDLERYLGEGRLDQFFVKNLETVQGDERDVIVFTVGYGRDEQGRVYNNFGALNRPGGARRLNVAVTRARRKVILVSSIRASDLRLPEVATSPGSLPPGAALLRAYLDYAERGTLPLVAEARPSDGLELMEEDVKDVVRSLGYEVLERVGTSRYRVDLGVVSQRQPGRIVLGIECDGQMYREARTARDRDRLRDAVLRQLGWEVYRIWAPDWYRQRAQEIERLGAAIASAEAQLDQGASTSQVGHGSGPEVARPERERVELEEIRVEDPSDAVELGWAVYYPVSTVQGYAPWPEFHDAGRWPEHATRIAALVAAEGPVHERLVTRRLTRAFGLQRAGHRIQEAVLTAIDMAVSSGSVVRRGPFVWPAGDGLDRVRVPDPANSESQRTIDLIPPEELDLALMRVAETAGTIPATTLYVNVARILGFDRTGGVIQQQLEVRANALGAGKRLASSGGAVTLGPKANLPPVARVGPSSPIPVGSWVRHPRFGEGRVLLWVGDIATVGFADGAKRIDTSAVPLIRIQKR